MTYELDPLYLLLNIDAEGSDDEPTFDEHDEPTLGEGFQPLEFDTSQNDDDGIDELLSQLGL